MVSAAISLVFIGKLNGVREGSIIAAVVVGNIIKGYNFVFDKIKRQFIKTEQVTVSSN